MGGNASLRQSLALFWERFSETLPERRWGRGWHRLVYNKDFVCSLE
jgi:hypothetical protein